jgi:glycerol-3-phosphate cytidylyltransferase
MIIGYTTGVYDLFHIGHLNLLRNAKNLCDHLIVGVTIDDLAYKRKHKWSVINFTERCEIISALRFVDEVVPQESMDKMTAWVKYHFNRMFVGSDWKDTPSWVTYETLLMPLGVEIIYLPHTDGISTTMLRSQLVMHANSGGGGRLINRRVA